MEITNLIAEGVNNLTNSMDVSQFTIPPLPQGNVTNTQLLLWFLGALIAALPALLGYLKTITLARKQAENKQDTDQKLQDNTTITKKASDTLVEVHDKVNGKMEELIRKSVDAALAKGKLDGITEEKNRKLAEEANQAIGKLAATEVPITIVPITQVPQVKI